MLNRIETAPTNPPAPLRRLPLGSFKQSIESYGNNEGSSIVASVDPAIQTYLDDVVSLRDNLKAQTRLSDLVPQRRHLGAQPLS